MSDEDNTLIQSVKRAVRSERVRDVGPGGRQIDWAKWISIGITMLAMLVTLVSGYVTVRADLKALQKEHAKDMANYKDWNKSISERLRELERR